MTQLKMLRHIEEMVKPKERKVINAFEPDARSIRDKYKCESIVIYRYGYARDAMTRHRSRRAQRRTGRRDGAIVRVGRIDPLAQRRCSRGAPSIPMRDFAINRIASDRVRIAAEQAAGA
jgi:hypothetical protein